MNYREELAQRLERVPFSARKVALRAGVSPGYVSDAKKRKAHALSLEMAEKINAALDELAREAQPSLSPQPHPQHHPAVEALASDPERMADLGIDEALLEELRSIRLPYPIETDAELTALLLYLKPARRRARSASRPGATREE